MDSDAEPRLGQICFKSCLSARRTVMAIESTDAKSTWQNSVEMTRREWNRESGMQESGEMWLECSLRATEFPASRPIRN